jgi:hypothetical protein
MLTSGSRPELPALAAAACEDNLQENIFLSINQLLRKTDHLIRRQMVRFSRLQTGIPRFEDRSVEGFLFFDADVCCAPRHASEDGCRVYLSSMSWPGWLLLSASKRRIGFQHLRGLSRTAVHRRWRTIVPSSSFPVAAVAGAATKRSISDCRPLADGWRLSGLLGQRSHESGPGMGIRDWAHRPGRRAVERRCDRRASEGNAARGTLLPSQVFEC